MVENSGRGKKSLVPISFEWDLQEKVMGLQIPVFRLSFDTHYMHMQVQFRDSKVVGKVIQAVRKP